MPKEAQELVPKEIWSKLSVDGQKLAISLAAAQMGSRRTQGKWLIDAMSKDGDKTVYDIEKSMKELSDFGVLEEVTLIEEKREQLTTMQKPDEIMLMPLTEVPPERFKERLRDLTDDERKYMSLAHEIEEFDQNHEKYADRYKGWVVPRFRLAASFQSFIDEQFKSK